VHTAVENRVHQVQTQIRIVSPLYDRLVYDPNIIVLFYNKFIAFNQFTQRHHFDIHTILIHYPYSKRDQDDQKIKYFRKFQKVLGAALYN